MRSNRRTFIAMTGTAFAALLANGCTRHTTASAAATSTAPYGPLLPDPQGFLDLPQGFSYRVISRLGDPMTDGGTVPDRADGMGCFDLGDGTIALVRNHELKTHHDAGGDLRTGFDRTEAGAIVPGGTTHVVLDAQTLEVRKEFRSLAGTIENCAGGTTPWGTWLSCEENVTRAGEGVARDHGWVFEVPANATGFVNPAPIKEMGRFNHEAACVDPETGIVYLTEDRDDSLLYRYIPNVPGQLADGGKLQALVADGISDSRNWRGTNMVPRSWADVSWIDCEDVESPRDDLRYQGAARGATLFARGEGIHMGNRELYFTCTSGGTKKLGQIFRLAFSDEGSTKLQLFFESSDPNQMHYGDNLTVSPNGHLVVCEDQAGDVSTNYLRGITPAGEAYPIGWLRMTTELAGACWSPDGKTLFVNAYSPTVTFAVTGPWIS